jgi:hypothetical protein
VLARCHDSQLHVESCVDAACRRRPMHVLVEPAASRALAV